MLWSKDFGPFADHQAASVSNRCNPNRCCLLVDEPITGGQWMIGVCAFQFIPVLRETKRTLPEPGISTSLAGF